MKANNGILIIDDFGRQRLRPEELLNRWVVPLDRKVDFLTLAGGKKIEIPFELMVVFATNMDPSELADAAFLRRIQTKIKVNNVSPAEFHEIFRRVCEQNSLEYSAELVDEVTQVLQNKFKEPLRACYPRDIVSQILWAARYEGIKPCCAGWTHIS
jgi:predicted ATPase with chaperone activity